MSTQNALAAFIRDTCGAHSTLSLSRVFIKMLDGDHVAALLLSQVVFWSEHTSNPEGWFWKTYGDWEEELCMTRFQVDRAVKKLKSFGVEREVKTIPGRRTNSPTAHYRVDREVLEKRILEYAENRVAKSFPAKSNCEKLAVENDNPNCEKPTHQPVRNSQLKVQETYNTLPISASNTTSITAAAEKRPRVLKPVMAAKKTAAADAPAQNKMDAPGRADVPLLEMTPEQMAALSPEEGVRRFRKQHPEQKWRDKFAEIESRPGIRSPRMVQWIEVRDGILPELRAKKEAASRPKPPRPRDPQQERMAAFLKRQAEIAGKPTPPAAAAKSAVLQ